MYARKLFGNLEFSNPPARGEFLLPRVIMELEREPGNSLTREEIAQRLGLTDEFHLSRLDKELEKGIRGSGEAKGAITRKEKHFVLRPQFREIKERLTKLVEEVCGRMFSTDKNVSYDERFKVDGRWITTNDLAFLSLMSLYMTIERCWKNRTLMIGVAKDTSARDLKRQVIPVLNHVGRFDGGFGDKGQDTPDTDRMILQWVSLHEKERLFVPWATVEYDTAFKTIIPHFERKPGLVSGARRNQISIERTFAKSYFQLCQAASDPKLRSNVLLYDRVIYPEFDKDSSQLTTLPHDYDNRPDSPESVDVVFYEGVENPIHSFPFLKQ